MKVYLYLENGVVFTGVGFGYTEEEVVGEVVFNTGMTGYQEVITDPSYYGQIVLMTYPLIGNYGINLDDNQSSSPKIKALIVKEMCEFPNNFRYEMSLDDYMYENKIFGMQDLDTRYLTKNIRDHGVMKGVLTKRVLSENEVRALTSAYDNSDAVKKVSTKTVYTVGQGINLAVMDFGIKQTILKAFVQKGCKLTVFPYNASAEEILSVNPQGIFLSNGPGDPKNLPQSIETIKKLVLTKPVIGICLGHQLLTLALGGDTEKLKFGHRGSNHPVKDLRIDRVFITSQNHGYVTSKVPDEMEVTHININDNSIEGMKHKYKNIFSLQYHPEACPGPGDSDYLLDELINTIKRG